MPSSLLLKSNLYRARARENHEGQAHHLLQLYLPLGLLWLRLPLPEPTLTSECRAPVWSATGHLAQACHLSHALQVLKSFLSPDPCGQSSDHSPLAAHNENSVPTDRRL